MPACSSGLPPAARWRASPAISWRCSREAAVCFNACSHPRPASARSSTPPGVPRATKRRCQAAGAPTIRPRGVKTRKSTRRPSTQARAATTSPRWVVRSFRSRLRRSSRRLVSGRSPSPQKPRCRPRCGPRPTFGFGLLDAVPAQEILALADPNDRDHDGISGRVHRLPDGRVGRFGRKAQEATLTEFNTGAFVMEMGVTNPGVLTEQTIHGNPLPIAVDLHAEPEITQDEFDAADAFVHFLAPPPRRPLGPAGFAGGVIFRAIGCASCHVPTLVTGPSRVRALNLRVFQPYTDLLLHDMGPALADICLGDARPAEFRTEPLMGLHLATAFLHDGRAKTIAEAIRLHGGEARPARDRFVQLSPGARFALLQFLRSL